MNGFLNKVTSAKSEYDGQPANKSIEPETFADVDMSVLVDFEAAQCEGEPDLIVELIDLYLADVPQQLSAIKNSILKADEVSLKRAAHNLKGSSANLGVRRIAQLCEELEQIDFIESLQKTNVRIERLDQAFAHVSRILSAERQNRAGVVS